MAMFGEEQWAELRKNPETAALLDDPEFSKVIKEIQANPAALGKHVGDERMVKLLTALAGTAKANAPPADGASAGADGASAKMEEEEEDLSGLPEEERKKKLAVRAKDKGNESYKKRDFITAIKNYTDAIELDPDNVSFLTNRAAAQLESGNPEGAIADCKLAVKLNSDKSLRTDFKIIARAYGRMGNAYCKLEQYSDAIEAYEKSLVEFSDRKIQRALTETKVRKRRQDELAYIDPVKSKEEREAGNQLFKEGKFPASIKKYTEAIKRNPKDAAPYSNRAAAYMKLGEFPMALKDCDKCLEQDDTYVKAYIRKGNIHFYMKEYHKCLDVYEKGLKIAPDNHDLKNGLMKTQMMINQTSGSGQVDEAQVQAAMRDPEIQKILSNPEVTNVLRQMESDPSYAAKAMQDPKIAGMVQKLIAAGILKTG